MNVGDAKQNTGVERFRIDEYWRSYIADCAEHCAGSYDERQDLISDTVRAILEYGKPIEHPKTFIWTTVRRLAINHGRVGAGAREFSNTEDLIEADPSEDPMRLSETVILRDTLARFLKRLTHAEAGCYELLEAGFEQRDLPGLMGVSRQAVSKLLTSMRSKYEDLEAEDSV